MKAALQGPSGPVTLEESTLSIGRAADNQFVISDPKASAHHAIIHFNAQDYHTIADLGSTNGTFVNEQRVDPNNPRRLYTGDKIRIGDTIFAYEADSESRPGGIEPTVVHRGPIPGMGSSPGYSMASDAFPTADANPYDYNHTGYGYPVADQSPQPAAPSYPPQQPWSAPATPGSFPSAPSYPPQPVPQPWGYPAAPGVTGGQSPYTPPPAPRKPLSPMAIISIIVAVAVLLLVGGGGYAVYQLTRPQPVISITSDYNVGKIPAGSTSTVFHVRGHNFAGSSAVTFLLDGIPVSGNPDAHSDTNGNVTTDLIITNGWPVGSHTLTARDAGNDTTKQGISLTIVEQGQAHTPGPYGSPPDDSSGSVNANIQIQDSVTGQTAMASETLTITGGPDPKGGKVCGSDDDGQVHTATADAGNGVTIQESVAATCSGTYKGGKLTYVETVTSEKLDFSNGLSCTAKVPYVGQHLEGSFTDHNTIKGTFTRDTFTLTCNQNRGTRTSDPETGTWAGQLL